MKPQIGLNDEERTHISQALAKVLADTAALTILARNLHWNVTGPHFVSLHAHFDEEYRALADAQDELAERIRALGLFAPGSLAAFAHLTVVQEVSGALPAEEMIGRLLDGHVALAGRAREALAAAEEAGDAVTADLLTVRLAAHDKSMWMLRSLLG
jgi:starvation-inducible DNA-binding protein